jgi:hypothetical protein
MDYKIFIEKGVLKILMPSEYDVVAGFLETEVDLYTENLVKELNAALLDKDFYFDWFGTAHGAEIRKNDTRVYAYYLDEAVKRGERVDDQHEAFIHTETFLKLVEHWKSEVCKFWDSKSDNS